MITIEEGAPGGFGAHVLSFLANGGLLETGIKTRIMTMPDSFFDHDKSEEQNKVAGLHYKEIVKTVTSTLGREKRVYYSA